MKLATISEAPVSMSEVKDILEKTKERDTILNFRAQKTLDYLQQNARLSTKKHKELAEAIAKLEVPRLKEQHIVKLCDVLPLSADDVKLVLQGYNVTITKENQQKIAETVKSAL